MARTTALNETARKPSKGEPMKSGEAAKSGGSWATPDGPISRPTNCEGREDSVEHVSTSTDGSTGIRQAPLRRPAVLDQRASLLEALSKALPMSAQDAAIEQQNSRGPDSRGPGFDKPGTKPAARKNATKEAFKKTMAKFRESSSPGPSAHSSGAQSVDLSVRSDTGKAPLSGQGNALSLDGVVKEFGGFAAVRDLSFSVRQGEIFGFLGPNGAGKTTTLRMILEIVPLTRGKISVLGSPSAIDVRHRIGYLPEERGLYRKMRAAQSIAYFAQLRGVPGREARKRAYALLEQFGLSEFARSKNEALSKGMAQKVQLLATIAHDPELLILDEPFSGLDPINQKTLEDLIAAMQAAGKTIIFSTHVMEHAERLCDRFLIVAKGQKRFEGTLTEARALMPSSLTIQTSASPEALSALPGVSGIERLPGETNASDDNDATYRIELTADGDANTFLKAAFARDIPIKKFDAANASLHDIFVSLAQEANQETPNIDDSKTRSRQSPRQARKTGRAKTKGEKR